jgi:G3E family GTPase
VGAGNVARGLRVARTYDDMLVPINQIDRAVVDAKHLLGALDQAHEAQEQLAFADVIILNKTDLVTQGELTRLTRLWRPSSPAIPPSA